MVNNKGQIPWNKGKKGVYSKKTIEKMSLAKKGKELPKEQKEKIRKAHIGQKRPPRTEEWKRKQRKDKLKRKGELASNWQGGKTPLIKLIRNSDNYKLWRSKVFERDNWRCQTCNNRGGIILHAHHIKRFNKLLKEFLSINNSLTIKKDKNKLLKLSLKHSPFWNIDNGVTLCKDCHELIKHKRCKYGKINPF